MQQLTVLIVDDSPEDRQTYCRYLLEDRERNYEILEEETGVGGLELYQQFQPDGILLDFVLPDLNGLEFVRELQQNTGHMPAVVMLTGQGSEAVAVQAMKCGIQDYLVKKDTTAESLRCAICRAIENVHLRQQLQQSEERFRTSVENMLDCFGIYSAIRDASSKIVDFRVDYVNAAACKNNRMTKEEQLGKRLCEILPAHRESGLFDEYCQVVETGKPLKKESLIYADVYNKQNLTRAFDIRATKLGDGFVASWRNVTEKKLVEAERARLLEFEQAARAEAEEANGAKDEFVAMIAHDLRSPLNAILGWTKMLQSRNVDQVTMRRALETIERNTKFQAKLLEDLLDTSRILRGKLELKVYKVSLCTIVHAALETAYPVANAKKINLVSVVDDSVPPIIGDEKRLQQILGNLLSNAIKFTPEMGRVEVRLFYHNNFAYINVSDTGVGISAEFLPYIFERYRQADCSAGGIGLGLAISRHLVEMHGGSIQVASGGKGQGATFTIKLPLSSRVR
jgi:signal transduction histidine kinase